MRSELLIIVVAISILTGCARSRSHQVRVTSGNHQVARSNVEEGRASLAEETTSEPTEVQLVSSEELPSPSLGDVPSTVSIAAPSTAATSGMRLSDFEELALRYNPTLSQAAAGVDQERGAYRQAGLYPNPQVGYINTTANQASPKQSNGVFLSQEIVTAKKIQLAQQSASQEIKRLQWDQEAQRIRVLNDINIRFYEVLGAQKALEETAELEKLTQGTLTSAEKLFEGKGVSKLEVNQARMQLATARIAHAEAGHRYDAAWKQLKAMVGVPDLASTTVVGDLESNLPILDEELCWQRLLAESPQLRASESELDHGRAELRAAESQAVPNVTLQTVTDYDRLSNSTSVSTLVALPLPLHNRNQGNIDKAFADIRADESEICRVQLVLRDQLADSFRRYNTARTQVEKLTESLLPDAQETLKLSNDSFIAGEISFRDVLFAQQAYTEARLAKLEALTEMQKVATEIEGLQLTGGLNPAAIGSAIQSQPGGASSRQRALLNEVKDKAAKQLLPAAQISQ